MCRRRKRSRPRLCLLRSVASTETGLGVPERRAKRRRTKEVRWRCAGEYAKVANEMRLVAESHRVCQLGEAGIGPADGEHVAEANDRRELLGRSSNDAT